MSTSCSNCGAERTSAYCPECGQPEAVRLTIRGFLRLVSSRVFSLDRGLLRTVVALFRSPGAVALEYVQGRRVWYTNPLTYWLLAATLQLLALATIQTPYIEYLEATMRYTMEEQPEAVEVYANLFKVEDPIPVLARVIVRAVTAAYTYLGVVFALILAVLLRLLTRTREAPFNVAEQLVFALYVVGHWAVITALILPLTFRISPVLHSAIGTTGYVIIAAWSSVDFHRAGLRGAMMTAVAMIGSLLAYLLVMLLVITAFIIVAAVTA